jgi:hypothetical protein
MLVMYTTLPCVTHVNLPPPPQGSIELYRLHNLHIDVLTENSMFTAKSDVRGTQYTVSLCSD